MVDVGAEKFACGDGSTFEWTCQFKLLCPLATCNAPDSSKVDKSGTIILAGSIMGKVIWA